MGAKLTKQAQKWVLCYLRNSQVDIQLEKLPLHSFFIQKAGRVKNLVIVESPAKAKTIEGFLGKDYVVKSSFGHIRDLSKKQLGGWW